MNEQRAPVAVNWKAVGIVGVVIVLTITLCAYWTMSTLVRDSYKIEYAKGFTTQKFRQVSLGMTKPEVHRLLGEPIGLDLHPPETRDKYPELWYYSWTQGSDPVPSRQFFVEFDNKGKVIGMAWPWE